MRFAAARILAVFVLLLAMTGAYLYSKGMHAAHPVSTLLRGTTVPGAPRRLIVFTKGSSADIDGYKPLLKRLLSEKELANSDLLLFDHQLGRLTTGHAYDFATRMRAEIDAQWIRNGGYDDGILAGHSYGSLLVREAYLQAAGRDPRQPVSVPWSARVSRIVLMAGIGRGVDAEEHGQWSYVLRIGRFIPFIRSSVMYDVLRGADFVTDVRIAWIRHFSEMSRAAAIDAASPRPPIVVQVIGTEDGIVHRDDNIDLEQFPTAYHLDVPGVVHGAIHRVDLAPNPELAYSLIREAFASRSLPHSAPRQLATPKIHRVVFLLHGMRSSRDDWVHEIAPLLRRRVPDAEVVESSYGWISMFQFALPSVRRREIRWLQDQYTEYLARYPDATFDVVAHSNGAYLVGQALQHVPSLRFGRVVLLGSVLPSDYSWEQRRAWQQAQAVRTDRTADDFVVAVLCNALRGVGMTDIGTSGWSGFENSAGVEHDITWFHGGHSAALSRPNLTSVADFLATGEVSDSVSAAGAGPSSSIALLSQLAPWLSRIVICLLVILSMRWLWRAPSRANRLAILATTAAFVMIVLDVI